MSSLEKHNTIGAIILAGGKSRRMGVDKAFLVYKGKPLIQHVLETVSEIVPIQNIVISSNSDSEKYQRYKAQVIRDLEEIRFKGPLAGMYSGMLTLKTEWSFVLSCDAPNISVDLLRELLNHRRGVQVTCPVLENQEYPLIGLYSQSVLPILKEHLEANDLKVTHFIRSLESKMVTLDNSWAHQLLNVNTVAEYSKLTASEKKK